MKWATLLLATLVVSPAVAADLSKLDRTIRKEPAYAGKPGYCLLVFGPEARDRVWLVRDGDTLYVDRNGDGDLTAAGKKVLAQKEEHPQENGYIFDAGDLTIGGRVHKGLSVSLTPLKRYAGTTLSETPMIRDALKADPSALVATLTLDVASPRFKGIGIGDRLWQMAGFNDLTGVLTFAAKPADAPVVHFDGPLTVTFYGEVPTLKIGRTADMVLMVGSLGRGPGTFAMLGYQDTIPAGLHPKVEIRWPGEPPTKELFELKERC